MQLRIPVLLASCLLAENPPIDGQGSRYNRSVSAWIAVDVPDPATDEFEDWLSAANGSEHEWRVYLHHGEVLAQLRSEEFVNGIAGPAFETKVAGFSEMHACQKVSDGWLIAFNRGEFGAALWWFSNDGEQAYKVSDHQVNQFLESRGQVYAVEGLAHLGVSQGSMIQIHFDNAASRWSASEYQRLPESPAAFAHLENGSFVIVMSDGLGVLSPQKKLRMLASGTQWGDLYPKSLVIPKDEKKAYIGMRQYVVEYDFAASTLRYLIPSREFVSPP